MLKDLTRRRFQHVRGALVALGVLILFLSSAETTLASDGDLDTTFGIGNSGVVTTTISAGRDSANAIAIDANGKILVVGTTGDWPSGSFGLVRYNDDGSLDSSFGSNGKVVTGFGDKIGVGRAVAVHTNGKIYMSGFRTDSLDEETDFVLARYSGNGSLDWVVTTDFNGKRDYGHSVAIDADGKILVAGSSEDRQGSDIAVARYNSDGSLDTSFGSGGKVLTNSPILPQKSFYGAAIAIDDNGNIFVAGSSEDNSNWDFALVRYPHNSSQGAIITTDVGGEYDTASAIAIDADGKIIVAGTRAGRNEEDFALVRHHNNGSLDTSFGSDGKVTTDFGPPDLIWDVDEGTAVAVDSAGRIIMSGSSWNGSDYDIAVARYNITGSLDTSFGSGGKVLTDFGAPYEFGEAIAIDSDGNIVVAGYSDGPDHDSDQNSDFAVVRYLASRAEPNLTVTKIADVDKAIIGETAITYSYRVTNNGDIPLTIQAVDDRLGPIPLTTLPGGTAVIPVYRLLSGQIAVGTRRYTPQWSDLPGPLANTVTVTGTAPSPTIPVIRSANLQVDLLVRSQTDTMYHGENITDTIRPQVNAAQGRSYDLVVIRGAAPDGLLLSGVEYSNPYTDDKSMIEMTNQLVTLDCPGGTACNSVTRIVFDSDGSYDIEVFEEKQSGPAALLAAT